MKKIFLALLSLVFVSNIYAFDLGSIASNMTNSESKESSLVDTITSSLGVTNTQAAGGITALLGNAATKMSKEDVSSLTSKVPEVSNFMGNDSSTSNLISSLASNSTVQEQFSALGLDATMISKFTPIILDFINSEAGSTLMNIVKSAI